MAYCTKCGTQNMDGAAFCSNCGALMVMQSVTEGGDLPVPNLAPVPVYTAPEQDGQKPKSGKTLIIAAVILAVGMIAAVILYFVLSNQMASAGGNSERSSVSREKDEDDNKGTGLSDSKNSDSKDAESSRSDVETAEGFVKAWANGDVEEMVEYYPSYYFDQVAEALDISRRAAKERVIETLTDGFEEAGDESENMTIISVKADIEEELTGKELSHLKEDYKDNYDVEIEAAEYVTVTGRYKIDGEKGEGTQELFLVKIDGSWYVDPEESNI